jgi:hypothetical protein
MIQIISNNTFLDVPEDLNIPINRSIADVREPENRQSDWTKTFTLAGTKTNKEYFSHLYEINYEITAGTQFSPDFNPNYRAEAEIWVDNIPQLKGFLRLIQINVLNDEHIEFECSMHGVTAELFTQIRGLKMSDLDFSEYNHEFNTTNVVTSWSNIIIVNGTPTAGGAGIGYIYGLVNDGRLNSYNDITLDFYKPFLYAKTVVDKILTNAGFTYTSGSFLNDNVFKGLIMSSDVGTPPSVPYLFNASASVDTNVLIGDKLTFDTETDPNGIFDLANDAITMGTKSGGICDVVIEGRVKMSALTPNEVYAIYWVMKQNGGAMKLGTSYVTSDGSGAVNDGIFITFDTRYLSYGSIYTVEVLDILPRNNPLAIFPTQLTMAAGFQMYNIKKRGAAPTQMMQFDKFFVGDIKQEDVLKSFVNMFNLYIDKDEDGKLIIMPYEDYYTGTVKDWSHKLDKSQNLSIYPMGELNSKRFYFTYAQGEDIFNKDYKEIYNRNYGDLFVTIDNDFVKDEKKIELVFKPTQVFTAEGRTYPLIDKFNGIHLLFHNSIATTNSYSIYDDVVVTGSSVPSRVADIYPLTIHTDTNITPTLDILFGTPFEAGYPQNVTYTDNNLYNAYWSRYINEITDPNSKVVTGYFHITPADFQQLSFRDVYFFENSYFRLNKIVDYVPDRLTMCEFVQLQTYPSFTPSSGDIGQSDWQELMGNKVVKIGEAQFFGDKDMIVGYKGGYTSQASYGNIMAGSSGTIIDGRGNVVLMSDNMNITGDDKMYLFGKEVDLSGHSGGVVYDGTKYISAGGVTSISSTTSITHIAGEHFYLVSTSGGAVTMNLPTAVGNKAIFNFVKTTGDGSVVTIDGSGSETINGSATKALGSQYAKVRIVSNGSNWIEI